VPTSKISARQVVGSGEVVGEGPFYSRVEEVGKMVNIKVAPCSTAQGNVASHGMLEIGMGWVKTTPQLRPGASLQCYGYEYEYEACPADLGLGRVETKSETSSVFVLPALAHLRP